MPNLTVGSSYSKVQIQWEAAPDNTQGFVLSFFSVFRMNEVKPGFEVVVKIVSGDAIDSKDGVVPGDPVTPDIPVKNSQLSGL